MSAILLLNANIGLLFLSLRQQVARRPPSPPCNAGDLRGMLHRKKEALCALAGPLLNA